MGAFVDLEAVAAHARSICAALAGATSICLCFCCCCIIIALPVLPIVSNGANGIIICVPASSIPPSIMDACPADDEDAVAAIPPKKLVYAAVAADPATEATPLFPWFVEEATANWMTRSRAVPEAEQSAMVRAILSKTSFGIRAGQTVSFRKAGT